MPNASRRIPKNLDETDTFKGYNVEDLAVAAGPSVVIIFIVQNLSISIPNFNIIALGFGTLLAALILFLTPNHLRTKEWVLSIGEYIRRPSVVRHVHSDYGMHRDQGDYADESKMFEVNETTQELTRVHRIHPDGGAIERDDEAMVGAVQVDPANMSLASGGTWKRMVNEWTGYLNNTLDYPLQIYVTSRTFPVDEYLEHYQRRVNDPDMNSRPILRELLRDFLDWYPEYIAWQGTNQREYYIIITVTPDEMYGRERDEESPLEKLAKIPKLGGYIDNYLQSKVARTEEERRVEMLREVNQRLREVERQGVSGLPGCSARQMTGGELALILKEYWSGEELDHRDPDNVVRKNPVVQPGDNPVEREEVAADVGYEGTDPSKYEG